MTSERLEVVADAVAVAILHDLACDGFWVELAPDDAIVITPRSRLTAERRQQIVDHKVAIKTLLRHDDGVQNRREAFARQLETAPPSILLLGFVFRDVPYVQGRCHACGDPLERLRWGSCWRCSLARRLACWAPVPADLFTAYDEARVCA